MNVFVVTINGKLELKAFTSLSGVCKEANVSYDSAIRGKRTWAKNNFTIVISELEIIKVKGRGQDIIGQKGDKGIDNQEY